MRADFRAGTSRFQFPELPPGSFLEGGVLAWLQGGVAQLKPNTRAAVRGAVLAVVVGWAPLLLLSALRGPAGLAEFLQDCGVHARLLFAAPLFVLADASCTPRIGAIARHFRDANLIPDSQLARFDESVADTRGRARSVAAGLIILAASYLVVLGVAAAATPHLVPAWHKAAAEDAYSLAGWWHVLVSLPLLVALFFAWIWRVILWSGFLLRMSRLDLQLVPAHPDRAAGLLFVGHSARAFAAVALPMGCIAAGAICNNMLAHGQGRIADWLILAIAMVAAFVMFAAPPVLFGGVLMRARRRGAFAYGALAGRLGRQFEQKWLGENPMDGSALEAPDFSATTDLYQIAANVYQMRFAPLDKISLLALAVAVLIPLGPVILLTIPFERVMAILKELLF